MVLLKNSFKFQASSFKFKTLNLCILASCILHLASVNSFAEEKVYRINIEGMHCKVCIYRVTKSLKRLKEVKDVEINLDKGTATVTLNDGEDVTEEILNEAVEDSGYKPTGVESVEK